MALYYNSNTLHINTGVANEDNIITSLRQAIHDIEIKLNTKYKCPFKVNIIRVRDKESGKQKTIGYGYIWIGNTEIYWILAGYNPDGSERIEEFADPNWTETSTKILDRNEDNLWADMIESEITEKAPMIKKQLPPIITLPSYKYSDEQLKELKERYVEFGLDCNDTMGHFTIKRAFVDPIPAGKMGYILCSRFVPSWIPTEVFKAIFLRYVSDPSVKIENISNKGPKKQIDTVPFISRIGDTLFITFDPQTKDASFARIMQRKTRIQDPNNMSNKCEIIFDYAFENIKNKIHVHRNNNKNIDTLINKKCLFNGYDYTILNTNDDQIQIKNEQTCEIKWTDIKNIEISY